MDASANADSCQYLTFRVAGERYAVAILQVREIIPYRTATTVPLTPASVRGVINLRGSVVPVIDLAVRFGFDEVPISKRSCVVIIDLEMDDERTVMGLLVEAVDAVIDLPAADVEATPSFGTGPSPEFLKGIGKLGEEFVAILDVGRVLSPDELGAVLDPEALPAAPEPAEDRTEPGG